MNLGIISIGKLKNSPLLELQNDYKKRILKLGKNIGINNLQIKEGLISKKNSIDARKIEEGEFFEKNLSKEKKLATKLFGYSILYLFYPIFTIYFFDIIMWFLGDNDKKRRKRLIAEKVFSQEDKVSWCTIEKAKDEIESIKNDTNYINDKEYILEIEKFIESEEIKYKSYSS